MRVWDRGDVKKKGPIWVMLLYLFVYVPVFSA